MRHAAADGISLDEVSTLRRGALPLEVTRTVLQELETGFLAAE